jgi:hypothetical protein
MIERLNVVVKQIARLDFTAVAKMKGILIALLILMPVQGLADSHTHHVRHNMVVYGMNEVFASHIVYKQPHNYQVILNVNFSDAVMDAYRLARTEHPSDTFIFLLEPGDISKIREEDRLTGSLFRRNSSGQRVDIEPSVTLEREAFRVEYFAELPLSLAID